MFLTPFISQGVQLNWTGLVHNQECIVGARVVVHRLIKGMLRLVYLKNLKKWKSPRKNNNKSLSHPHNVLRPTCLHCDVQRPRKGGGCTSSQRTCSPRWYIILCRIVYIAVGVYCSPRASSGPWLPWLSPIHHCCRADWGRSRMSIWVGTSH